MWLVGAAGLAQAASLDTLALAHQLKTKGRYAEISKLMAAYCAAHPANGYAEWIWADALAQRGKLRPAVQHYAKAQSLLGFAAGEPNFRLSHARALLMASHMGQASAQLDTLERGGFRYPEITALRARQVLWQGRISEGAYQVQKLTFLDKKNPELPALAAEVHQATAPWVQVSLLNSQDNQPLQRLAFSVDAGYYKSASWQPKVHIETPVFVRDGKQKTVLAGSISNTFFGWRTGTSLTLQVGATHFANGTTAPTGSILLRQGLVGKLAFELAAERAANLTTRASIDTAVLYNRLAGSLLLRPSRWAVGQATYENHYYADGNTITIAYAYLLGPRLRVGKVEARVGYSFAYSDATKTRYTANHSLTDIVNGWSTTTNISGVYIPYFSPKDQHVHSLLAQVVAKPNAALEVGASGSYGVEAYNLNPYLYLTSGTSSSTELAVGYNRYTFTPYNVKVYVQWQLTPSQTLRLGAERIVNPFYSANLLQASFKVLLK
jgi:hypothetical protein